MPRSLIPVAAILALAGSASAEIIYGVTTRNQLVSFDSATPGSLNDAHFITGLQGSEEIIGIDFRPATGELFGLGSSSRLYKLNTATAAATLVGPAFTPQLNGIEFGMDFNPTVDRVRVVSDLEQNLRLDPVTGAVAAVDTNLNYPAGGNPNVVGVAYTNNIPGSTTTTLYGIDSVTDSLVIINPPNNGTLNNVGALGFNTNGMVGFDISGGSGTAFASLNAPGSSTTSLYTINLASGVATAVGVIGVGTDPILIRDITVTPVPSASSLALLGLGGLLGFRRRR